MKKVERKAAREAKKAVKRTKTMLQAATKTAHGFLLTVAKKVHDCSCDYCCYRELMVGQGKQDPGPSHEEAPAHCNEPTTVRFREGLHAK